MNKTVLVTGATDGTGYCIAQKFAENGYNVCITSREAARAKEAAARLKEEVGGKVETFGYGLDVLDEQQIIDMFDELKAKGCPVGSFVGVAANLGLSMAGFFEVDYRDWIRVVETNIGWNFMFARQAARHMVELGGGSIVFIGSATGIRAIKNRSAYTTSKSGLHGLDRNLAVELGSLNIRVNTVISGGIKTSRYYARPEIKDSPHNKTPMGDIAEFRDIANAAYFLADNEQARIITGAELAVDGGSLAQFVYEEEGIRFTDGTSHA